MIGCNYCVIEWLEVFGWKFFGVKVGDVEVMYCGKFGNVWIGVVKDCVVIVEEFY